MIDSDIFDRDINPLRYNPSDSMLTQNIKKTIYIIFWSFVVFILIIIPWTCLISWLFFGTNLFEPIANFIIQHLVDPIANWLYEIHIKSKS